MSIWSYMTAAIVATTVASNMVNNVSICCLEDAKKNVYRYICHDDSVVSVIPVSFCMVPHMYTQFIFV